jgi:inositol polyphosphate-4-phosphatase
VKGSGGGRMRFNKWEVAALASQPSHKFEKEGVLFVRERQESFFRRTESMWIVFNYVS